MKAIWFMTHSGLIVQDGVLAGAAREALGVRTVAVVQGRRDQGVARAQPGFDEVLDLVDGFRPEPSALAPALDRIAACERASAGADTAAAAFLQDRWLTKRFDASFAAVYGAHVLEVLEGLASRCEPVAMVGELTMLHHRLARMRFGATTPYFYPMGSRFFNRFYLEDGLFLEWRECQERYQEFRTSGVPDSSAVEAHRVIDGIRKRGERPAEFKNLVAHPSPSAEPLAVKLRMTRLRTNLRYWTQEFPERSFNPRVLAGPLEMFPASKLLRWGREYWRGQSLARICASEIPDVPFVSAFLHYQPEYTVDTLGFPYRNQLDWVRLVAESVPADTLVLVKEQPFMIGARQPAFYETLLAMPNVRLVAAGVNGRELARRSKAVFTISGTVALEAMILGVPTFIFSPVFHSGFEGITRVRDPFELPAAVKAVLDGVHRPVSDEACLAALGAMHATSIPGELTGDVVMESSVRAEHNLRDLRLGFPALLERMLQRFRPSRPAHAAAGPAR